MNVPDGPIERAAQLDQLLDCRRDHFGVVHVLAWPGHVIDGLRRAVQIPLAGLVEQFEGVFDVVRRIDLDALLSPGVLEIRLEHGHLGQVALAADAEHFASRVVPDIDVTELQVSGAFPLGHFDRRGGVTRVARPFQSGRRRTAGADGPHAVDVKLAEIVHRRHRPPAALLVRLPAGDAPATADDGRLVVLGSIDHVVPIRARILRLEDEGVVDRIGAAAEHDDDVALHVLVYGTDRLAGSFERGKRLLRGAWTIVATSRSHVQRSRDRRPGRGGGERAGQEREKQAAGGHDPILSCGKGPAET